MATGFCEVLENLQVLKESYLQIYLFFKFFLKTLLFDLREIFQEFPTVHTVTVGS